MGFFGKKKKKIDLDLPPPPPPSSKLFPIPPPEEGKKETEPDISKPISSDLPPLPPLEGDKEVSPNLDLKDLEKDIPPVPDIEELESELPPLREEDIDEFSGLKEQNIEPEEEEPKISAGPIEHKKFPSIEEEQPELTQVEEQEIKGQPVSEVEEPRLKEGPIFVNVDSYKDALSKMILIRVKIKESEDCLKKLNEIKNSKDKYFEQFRVKLEDLQRKNLYIDKSLFQGGVLNE